MSLKSRKLQDCLLTFRPNVNLASAFSFQQILVASPRLTSHRLAEHKGNNFTSPRNLSCCSNKSISLRRPSIKAESLHSCTTWNKLVLTHQVFTENLVENFDFPRFRFTIADSPRTHCAHVKENFEFSRQITTVSCYMQWFHGKKCEFFKKKFYPSR